MEDSSSRGRAEVGAEQMSRLQKAAKEAVSNAYAPYSGLHVGSAVLTDSGEIFTGCNVENASYGLTICAERAAIFAAVGHEGPATRIRAIAICCDSAAACSPCGACRQVIAEFGDAVLVTFSYGSTWKTTTSTDLLPDTFRL